MVSTGRGAASMACPKWFSFARLIHHSGRSRCIIILLPIPLTLISILNSITVVVILSSIKVLIFVTFIIYVGDDICSISVAVDESRILIVFF